MTIPIAAGEGNKNHVTVPSDGVNGDIGVAVQRAVNHARTQKPASRHTFRQSFATDLLEDGYEFRAVQELIVIMIRRQPRSTLTF